MRGTFRQSNIEQNNQKQVYHRANSYKGKRLINSNCVEKVNKYSNSLNSSSEITNKNIELYYNNVNKENLGSKFINTNYQITDEATHNIPFQNAFYDHVKKPRHHQYAPSDPQKLSQFYDSSFYISSKPKSKYLDANIIIQQMETPKQSDHTTVQWDSNEISPVAFDIEKTQDIKNTVTGISYVDTSQNQSSKVTQFIENATFSKPILLHQIEGKFEEYLNLVIDPKTCQKEIELEEYASNDFSESSIDVCKSKGLVNLNETICFNQNK